MIRVAVDSIDFVIKKRRCVAFFRKALEYSRESRSNRGGERTISWTLKSRDLFPLEKYDELEGSVFLLFPLLKKQNPHNITFFFP